MADETRETREQTYEEEETPQDVDETARGDEAPPDDDGREWRDEGPPADDDRGYEEPAPELGQLNRDYMIPGVSSEEIEPVPLAHRREARPRGRGRDRDHRSRQAVRSHPDPERPQPGPSRQPDLDGAGPLRHRQERADQAHRRPALPGRRRRARARRVGPEHDRRRAVRDAQEVRPPVPGRGAVRVDERFRQHGVPASPAHRQVGGRDRRDLSTAGSARWGWPRRCRRCRTSSPAGCASGRASRAPSCSIRRSSCSTSLIPASTRCGRRSCAS